MIDAGTVTPMARLDLSVAQFNPMAQAALKELNDRLPDGLFVASDGGKVWVAHPDHMDVHKARAATGVALRSITDTVPHHGITLPDDIG